ncbi:ran-binding protein 3-like isoform X2 [Polypterus senegalus]|uniref:ran-binding protein 3-like isoform X2 n=1 Tax=Polypterus senegalus TaxID=55291 RepID=UPI0019638697|nr:ran-binding protein 3-like isoform X2 [Polypterus senegalus]
MRSHQLTPGKVAGLYSAIVPLSTDPVSPPIAEKLRSPSYQGEGWGATVQEEITENSIHNLHGSSPHLKQQQQESSLVIARVPKEKPTIAPPVFIFQKAERPLKRSAENSRLENAGLGAILEKRGRSSSFTFSGSGCQSQADSSSRDKRVRSSSFNCTATSFPPQPAPRNNVFMPSSLSMINTERGNFTPESVPAPSNGKKNVIRPATLPAPQPQSITFPAANEAAPGSSIGASCLPQRDEKGHQKVTLETVCLQANYDANRESACSPFLHLSTKEISRKCLDQEMSGREANLEFVFGENMSERVLSPVKPSFSEDSESDDSSDEETTSSGTESSCSETYCKIKHRTLRESAAAYTAASSQRCLLEEVDVFTGEEDESNVLQMTCKLFVFEKATQTWSERGRGVLRLNDKVAEGPGCLQSRLVMRNQGNLKLILNSRLWAQMHLHRASRKMLRFTAVDLEDQTVRVFLVQATLKEVSRLYVAIHHRLVLLQNCAKKNQENQLSPRKLQPQSGVPVLNYDSEKEDEDDDDEEEEEEKLVRIACPRSGQSKWSRSGTRSQAGICT